MARRQVAGAGVVADGVVAEDLQHFLRAALRLAATLSASPPAQAMPRQQFQRSQRHRRAGIACQRAIGSGTRSGSVATRR